jgi:hypothetical protein
MSATVPTRGAAPCSWTLALLGYYNTLRIQDWIGNLALVIETGFFGQGALTARVRAGHAHGRVLGFEVETHVRRLGEGLLPLLDRPRPPPCRRRPTATAGAPLLLPRESLLDVLAAELGPFYDSVANAREHLLEPWADLTPADLLGAPLDPFGRLVYLGLVSGASGPARESQGREESGSDPHPAKFL